MENKYTISNHKKEQFKKMAEDLAEKAAIQKVANMDFEQLSEAAKELVNGLTPALLGCEIGQFPTYYNDICTSMAKEKLNGKTAIVIIKAFENISPAITDGIDGWLDILKELDPLHTAFSEAYLKAKEKELKKILDANPEYSSSLIMKDTKIITA